MKPRRLQKWWEGIPVTILTNGVARIEGTNTISDRFGDADLVWDPGNRLESQPGVMRCTLHRRGRDVFTVETGCRCGRYDITDLVAIHHYVTRLDAMVEVAVKLGACTIYCACIPELHEDLVDRCREAGIQIKNAV